MIDLVAFVAMAAILLSVVFWLVHNTNKYERQQRKLRQDLLRANQLQRVPNVLLDVVRVEARPDYTLRLEFENGERRVFDMNPLMDKKPFVRLKGSPLFMKAFVDYGTVVWPGNIDIAPETLYDMSNPDHL